MKTMKKIGLCAVVGCGVLLAVISSAQAQRDAGSKARGEFGTGFWDSSSSSRNATRSAPQIETRQSFSYQPITPFISEENRQSFSHQPGEFTKGDKVVVTTDKTNIGKGQQHVATLNRGETFEVKKVEGIWLGVVIYRDGEKLSGWVNKSDVAHEGQTVANDSNTRQFYSVEPTQQYNAAPQYRAPAVRKDPSWSYSKADPRRYQAD